MIASKIEIGIVYLNKLKVVIVFTISTCKYFLLELKGVKLYAY